jgi:hypothetical protein
MGVRLNIASVALALLVSLAPLCTRAQDSEKVRLQYQNGKELFDAGSYGLAMQAFKPLTSAFNENIYTPYASYYYAIAAYKEGEISTATSMFRQILARYPQWEHADEVRLWLYKINLDDDAYTSAIAIAGDIQNDTIKAEAKKWKKRHLSAQDPDTLRALLDRYTSDVDIADALASAIARQPLEHQDRDLLENLVAVYQLDPERFRIEEDIVSEKKVRYQVAVLLPFLMNELTLNPERISNQFILDIYRGITLGVEALKAEGIEIKLFAYDTKKDSITTRNLLSKPEMQHMDLVIGPLFPAPVRLVSQFCYDYQINMINPLSSNSEIVDKNPYAFLFSPTLETIASKTARYISGKLHNTTAMIFYGEETQDSILAHQYKATLEQDGHPVKHMEMIRTEEAKRILDILTRTVAIDYVAEELDSIIATTKDAQGNLKLNKNEFLMIRPGSVGQVFIATENAPLAANAITALETRGDSIMLVGLDDWLNSSVITIEALERLNAHLIAPLYVDKSSEQYSMLKDLYMEAYLRPPEDNTLIGYDLMTIIGRMLHKYGDHFQSVPGAQDFKPGTYTGGFMLDKTNTNQYVQIIKFIDSELVVANPKSGRQNDKKR